MFNEAKRFFENLNGNDEAKAEMKRFNKTVHFKVEDGEDFWVNIKEGACQVDKKPDEGLKSLTYFIYAELLDKIIKGKIRFTDAYMGQLTKNRGDKRFLRPQEAPAFGGSLGGTLVVWTGKLIRIAQEIR